MIPANKDRTAFPSPSGLHNPGMTIRDYFAGQVIVHCLVIRESRVDATTLAYMIADAMMKERAK